MVIKRTLGDKLFDGANVLLLYIFSLICMYPLLYVIFAAFSDPREFVKHSGILYHPLGFSLTAFKIVFQNPNIISGYSNTLIYVTLGTFLNLLASVFGAYVLSRKTFAFKKPMMKAIVFTMYFHGGLIPLFLLVNNLGLFNSRFAIILPTLIGTWNLIVMRTAFMAIPDELEESAKMDGANDFIILFKIILPVAKATLAVMTLFYAVNHWNSWFSAMIYLRDRKLFPLQLLLREILIANSSGGNTLNSDVMEDEKALIFVIIKYATIVVATVPILFIYPFCQKYFMKGVMLGSVKG